jgi:hypothetical protein
MILLLNNGTALAGAEVSEIVPFSSEPTSNPFFRCDPVWWSSKKTYKNAITNELFLYTSALRYLRTHNQTYLDNAQKVGALCHVRI